MASQEESRIDKGKGVGKQDSVSQSLDGQGVHLLVGVQDVYLQA